MSLFIEESNIHADAINYTVNHTFQNSIEDSQMTVNHTVSQILYIQVNLYIYHQFCHICRLGSEEEFRWL